MRVQLYLRIADLDGFPIQDKRVYWTIELCGPQTFATRKSKPTPATSSTLVSRSNTEWNQEFMICGVKKFFFFYSFFFCFHFYFFISCILTKNSQFRILSIRLESIYGEIHCSVQKHFPFWISVYNH